MNKVNFQLNHHIKSLLSMFMSSLSPLQFLVVLVFQLSLASCTPGQGAEPGDSEARGHEAEQAEAPHDDLVQDRAANEFSRNVHNIWRRPTAYLTGSFAWIFANYLTKLSVNK